jgi:hypothetical protein
MRLQQQRLSPAALRVPANDLSPDAQAAWRHMRDEGGWYTADQLAAELQLHAGSRNPAGVSARWLYALARRGHVATHPTDSSWQPKRYGVTHRCFPVPGESLEPSTTTSTRSNT